MDDMIIKRDAVSLLRKRLKELLKPFGFVSHPKSKTLLIHVREDNLIEEVGLRTDGYHLEPFFSLYYSKAPFSSLSVDWELLWRIIKEQENISMQFRWYVEFLQEPKQRQYYYNIAYFEAVWQDVRLVIERYILPYIKVMTVKRLLSLVIKGNKQDTDFFRPNSTVFFSDKYFTCMSEAAVYGVGMWVMENYTEGLPYMIFARNKYREWTRNQGQDLKDPMYLCYKRVLEMLDAMVCAYDLRPQTLKSTVQNLTDQMSADWAYYI